MPVLAMVLLTGCDRQSQVGSLREEFQHQLESKDKTIEDLNHRLSEAERQRADLEVQLAKSAADPAAAAKLADAVSEAVAQKQAAKLDELKALIEKLGGSRSVAGPSRGPDTGAPEVRPRPEGEPERGPSSDPSRKKYKMDF